MRIDIEYTEKDLKELIMADLRDSMPGMELTENDIHIEVKSKQNYKSEWESASFRGRVHKI